MALQRECLAFVPTIPSDGGPTLWFNSSGRFETDAPLLADGETFTSNEGLRPQEHRNTWWPTFAFVQDQADETGWEGNLLAGFTTIPITASGVLDQANGDGANLASVGDGTGPLVGLLDVQPPNPAPTLSANFEWQNVGGGPAGAQEAIFQDFYISVPWTIPDP